MTSIPNKFLVSYLIIIAKKSVNLNTFSGISANRVEPNQMPKTRRLIRICTAFLT